MYNDYKDHADFLAVYIREAHPLDEWEMKKNLDENVCYPQPKTLAQRIAIANDFMQRFRFPLPLGIDPMNDVADRLYGGWPERLYIIDEAGKLVYCGGLGPFNYHPDEVRAWLKQRFPAVQTSSADSCPDRSQPRVGALLAAPTKVAQQIASSFRIMNHAGIAATVDPHRR